MNHSSSGLLLSKAIDGFLRFKVVEGLSERTLKSYLDHLNRFSGHVGDIQMANVTVDDVEDFIYWLRTEYVPQRLSGKQIPLSNKTIYNIWVTLKSFFRWAQGRRFV